MIRKLIVDIVIVAIYVMMFCLSVAGMIWAIRLLVNMVG